MKPKSIAVISIISILIISIVTSIIGWNFRTYDSRFSDQECKRSGEYCIFNEIPDGMMYSKPSESMVGSQEFSEGIGDYLYTIYDSPEEYSPKDIERPMAPIKTEDFYIWNIEDSRCNSTDKKPRVIEYFSEFCGSNRRYGCGEERRAVVCGTEYLIQDVKDYNSNIYGPYDLPNPLN